MSGLALTGRVDEALAETFAPALEAATRAPIVLDAAGAPFTLAMIGAGMEKAREIGEPLVVTASPRVVAAIREKLVSRARQKGPEALRHVWADETWLSKGYPNLYMLGVAFLEEPGAGDVISFLDADKYASNPWWTARLLCLIKKVGPTPFKAASW